MNTQPLTVDDVIYGTVVTIFPRHEDAPSWKAVATPERRPDEGYFGGEQVRISHEVTKTGELKSLGDHWWVDSKLVAGI